MSDLPAYSNITDHGSSIEATLHGSVQVIGSGQDLQIFVWKDATATAKPVCVWVTKDTIPSTGTGQAVLKVRLRDDKPSKHVPGNETWYRYLSQVTRGEVGDLTGVSSGGGPFQVKHVPVNSADGRSLWDGWQLGQQGDRQDDWEIVFETKPEFVDEVRANIDWTDASIVNPASLQSADTGA